MASPIRLEWEEDGLHVEVDANELRGFTLEMDGGTARGVMHGGQALAFYEHVRDTLAPWYAEAQDARVSWLHESRLQYAGEDELDLDPLDPKHPQYAENLRDLGDIARKRDRES